MNNEEWSLPLAVQVADEVLAMHTELVRLRAEVEVLSEYKQKYTDELQRGIEHSRHMIGGMLQLVLVPGVMDAISVANGGKTEGVSS